MSRKGPVCQGLLWFIVSPIIVAVGGTIVAGIIGILLGLVAGYMGGFMDAFIMRIMDGLLAFPFVLLSIILMTVLGPGNRQRDHSHRCG